MHTEKHYDKSSWGAGAWQDEPDKVAWFDDRTGLPCVIVRAPLGNWCGYVGLPKLHPLHGLCYDETFELEDAQQMPEINVHWGLTFSGPAIHPKTDEEKTILTKRPVVSLPPAMMEDDTDLWFFGFDCAHCDDYVPLMYAQLAEVAGHDGKAYFDSMTYRDEAFVKAEVTRLAHQLAEVK